jgi:hypothetical protein
MSDWEDCTFVLTPQEHLVPLDIILRLADYPHSRWEWHLLIQKPWPCVDGIYEPPLVSVRTGLGYNLVWHIQDYADNKDPLVQKILYSLKEDRNPVLVYGSKLYALTV